MTVRNRQPPIMYANSNIAGVELALREAFTKAGNAAKAQPQLLVCILPTTGVSSPYANLKGSLLCMAKSSALPTLSLVFHLNAIKYQFHCSPFDKR